MSAGSVRISLVIAILGWCAAPASGQVPTEIQQPGTQPHEVGNLESPDKCDNCHGGYNREVEPAFNWRGSLMAGAGRDPIFWATVAVAEQDFPGAGDLCIRCHSPEGWAAGRSTPTDGSALLDKDANGVACDLCHKMTRPDRTEHLGVQFPPFLAFDPLSGVGYFGSGMAVLWGGNEKLGPYSDAAARHQFMQSRFHRSVDFCGTCHDVSNPAVGDLAHNAGTQETADPVQRSGIPGAPVEGKAAFNNFPYQYGIVERTFSEFKASRVDDTRVRDYATLPAELQAGAFAAAYDASMLAGRNGDYADGTPRYFSCQTCHVSPTVGLGCNKEGVPIRRDLPHHDMTGGNYWIPDAIAYLNALGRLRLGGAMTPLQLDALNAGKARARRNLDLAASLEVVGNTLRIVNLTGHKLISGYPEGRRMWLNIRWFDAAERLVREDGQYGPMEVLIDGQPRFVNTILNLHDSNTKIFEAHYGMTQEWARQLLSLGYNDALALRFDRANGAVTLTLGQLASLPPGSNEETFHFVLNNTVMSDNRIPPYGMDYELARQRNALPVPADQYNGLSGTYNHFDDFALNPPPSAVAAEIALLYQPTSWEYIQFLYLANDGSSAFLADEGRYLLDAWLNTGMAQPYVMASAMWTGGGGGTPVLPHSFTVRRSGGYTGTVEYLHESDDQRLALQSLPLTYVTSPAIVIDIYGSSHIRNPERLTVILEASASIPMIAQVAELFNFNAGRWETIDTFELDTIDAVRQVTIDSGAARFVDAATGGIQARLLYAKVGSPVSQAWFSRIDQAIWIVEP